MSAWELGSKAQELHVQTVVAMALQMRIPQDAPLLLGTRALCQEASCTVGVRCMSVSMAAQSLVCNGGVVQINCVDGADLHRAGPHVAVEEL